MLEAVQVPDDVRSPVAVADDADANRVGRRAAASVRRVATPGCSATDEQRTFSQRHSALPESVATRRSTRAGLPATMASAGTSRVTTLPAPTMARSPMTTFDENGRARSDRRALSSPASSRPSSRLPSAARPSAVVARGIRVVDERHAVADEDVVLDRHAFADERVARDLAAAADRRVLLDLDERADLRLVADLAAVEVDELRQPDVLPELDVGRDRRRNRRGRGVGGASRCVSRRPFPRMTARGVASRILRSVHREQRPGVAQVEAHHLVERRAAAAGHLPQAGDPGLASSTRRQCQRLVLLDLVRERRPRSDERHVAAQHVPELRQLVEAGLAQDAADRRDPRDRSSA